MDDVREGARRLAAALAADVERIAERSAERMQRLLPAYARLPREQVVPSVVANMRNMLELIREPDADSMLMREGFEAAGDTRARQGISSHDMLAAWRIGLEAAREEAYAAAGELGLDSEDVLDFIEATLRWGDVGMRATTAAHIEKELRELARLAEEQAALRRVATQVAQGVPPRELFAAVTREAGVLLGADQSVMARYEPDRTMSIAATWRTSGDDGGLSGRWPLGGGDLATEIERSRAPYRIDDWRRVDGAIAAFVREHRGHVSSVGAPIVVDGRLWGLLILHRAGGPLPADTEARLENFTELVATAIANVQAHADLAASRSRLASAAHEERRRVARDLHDGAQQRLVHTVLTLKLAQRALQAGEPTAPELVAEALGHANDATVELRELAHGIMPAALASSGLGAGVDALASRMQVPVRSDVAVGRFPADIEATAYFVVAEALTNVTKHARATRVEISARHAQGLLHVCVRDDGVGGAQPGGSGLLGLADRLAAVDGRLQIDSPAGGGTVVEAWIPV